MEWEGPEYFWITPYACPQGLPDADCADLGTCEPEFASEEIHQVVETGDARQIVAVLENPGVLLVAERSAIQVMDCQGDHVAYQVSLEPGLLTEVAQLQQQ